MEDAIIHTDWPRDTRGANGTPSGSIEEPEVIANFLAHLERTAPGQFRPDLPLGARTPPSQASLIRI